MKRWVKRFVSIGIVIAVIASFALAGIASQKAPSVPSTAEKALVARVIDGDTIQLDDGRKVRLIGVDTPETVHPQFVNVSGCRASILMLESEDPKTGRTKYKDITDLIPNGEQLAADAVEDFGGALNISGWYPPSFEILDAIEKVGG